MSKHATKEKEAEETSVSTAVAALAPAPALPATFGEGLSLDDLQQDAGHGLQNVEAGDLATPMVIILQSNSPQVKRSDGKYIEGAIEGQVFNNVTNERHDGTSGIIVIPCHFEKKFVEWKPNRGGFVASHPVNTDLKDKVTLVVDKEGKQIPTLPNGNSLIETNQHYVLILKADGSFEAALIPMKSTDLRASRIWNALQKKVTLKNSKGQLFTPASYYMTYKLTAKARTKDQYSWYSWNAEPAGPTPTRELYEAAKAFEQAVASGKVVAKMDPDLQATSEPATVVETAGDEIPF